MISNSYFTGWACALVDSDAAAICLLPAGVVLFLIPKRLKVCIDIILSWCLLFWLLSSWLGISLLWSIVVSWNIMMYWLVVDWLVMDWFVVRFGVVVDIVLSQMFWMVTIDDMVLSVFGLIGFMDSLWVYVVVIIMVVIVMVNIVVVVIVMVIVVVVIVVMAVNHMIMLSAIDEWVIIDSFVVSISMVVIAVMII